MSIYFDMDGTLVDFYGVHGWLNYLLKEDTTPYLIAAPRLNMSVFARYIHRLQADGHKVGIISWCSKKGSPSFNMEIEAVKLRWLAKHLPSIQWDEIHIVPYGTPKFSIVDCEESVLFDDEENNRWVWEMNGGFALDAENIIENIKVMLS